MAILVFYSCYNKLPLIWLFKVTIYSLSHGGKKSYFKSHWTKINVLWARLPSEVPGENAFFTSFSSEWVIIPWLAATPLQSLPCGTLQSLPSLRTYVVTFRAHLDNLISKLLTALNVQRLLFQVKLTSTGSRDYNMGIFREPFFSLTHLSKVMITINTLMNITNSPQTMLKSLAWIWFVSLICFSHC